jgi:hypothetical protein
MERSVCITPEQRTLHVAAETVAVVAVAPFMIWLGTRKELPTWARVASVMVGVGTLAIDGHLLARYVGLSRDEA